MHFGILLHCDCGSLGCSGCAACPGAHPLYGQGLALSNISHPGKSELPTAAADKRDIEWGGVPWWCVRAVFWGIRRGFLKTWRFRESQTQHSPICFASSPPMFNHNKAVHLPGQLLAVWLKENREARGYIQTLFTGAGSHPCLWDHPQGSLLQADLSPGP